MKDRSNLTKFAEEIKEELETRYVADGRNIVMFYIKDVFNILDERGKPHNYSGNTYNFSRTKRTVIGHIKVIFKSGGVPMYYVTNGKVKNVYYCSAHQIFSGAELYELYRTGEISVLKLKFYNPHIV